MAIKLPDYEATQTIQPGPLVSAAPPEEGKALGDINDITYKALQRRADNNAVAEGAVAGEDIAFKPAKGFGRATQIYNKAALESNKYMLSTDIGTKMQNLTSEIGQRINGNESLDEFRVRSQAYANGLLSSVPAENQAYAKNVLQAHINNGLSKIQELVTKQNNEFAFVGFYDNLQKNKDQTDNFAFQGNGKLAISGLVKSNQMIDNGIKAGFLTSVQAKIAKLEVTKSFNINRLLYKYQLAQQRDKNLISQGKIPTAREKFRKLFVEDKLDESYKDIFSPKERVGFMTLFDQLDKIEFQKQQMTAAHLKNLKDNLLFKVSHGGSLDQDTYASILSADKNPDDFIHQVDLAKQTSNMAEVHQYSSLKEQAAASDDLQTIKPEDVARPDALDWHNAKLNAAKQIDNFKNTRLNDPVDQLQNSPTIQSAFQDINNKELNITKEQALINYQKTLKQPDNKIRVQTNLQAAQDVQYINQLSQDPEQGDDAVLNTLINKRNSDPAAFHYYFNGLTANGLNPKYQTMMNMWMNPMNRANIDIYAKAWNAAHTSATGTTLQPGKGGSLLDIQVKKRAQQDTTVTDIDKTISTDVGKKMTNFISSLTAGAADNTKTIQQATDDVENVTKYLYAERGEKLKKAEDDAYDMIIGKLFPVIPKTYRVPYDVNPDQVKAKMHEMDLAIKRGDAKLKLVAGEGREFDAEQQRWKTNFVRNYENRDLFVGGSWTNNPNGKGYVKLTVDGNMVYDENTGEPYGFTTDGMEIKPQTSNGESIISKGLKAVSLVTNPLHAFGKITI